MKRKGAYQKKRVVMSRIVSWKDHDRTFDLVFWRKVGVQGRFEAAWDMVRDLAKWKPRYAPEPRLRRSVALLQLRPH